MAKAIWFGDGNTWVAPGSPRRDVVGYFAPSASVNGRWLAHIETSRRRVLDRQQGKRVTRDWRTAIAVIWDDGEAPVLGCSIYREIMAEVEAAGGADEVLAYGRLCTIHGMPGFSFSQFLVRAPESHAGCDVATGVRHEQTGRGLRSLG